MIMHTAVNTKSTCKREVSSNTNDQINYLRIYFILIVVLILGGTAISQTTTRPDRGFGGGGSFQSTDIDSISLQNGGLNLHIPLASLPTISGDKLSYTLEATYNSKLWQVNHGETHHQGTLGCEKYSTVSVGGADGGAGWQIGAGYQIFFRQAHDDFDYYPINEQCEGSQTVYNAMILHRWFKPMLRAPDGSEHEMRIDGSFTTFPSDFNHDYLYGYYQWPGTDAFLPTFSAPTRFYTIDGTYLTAIYNPPSTPIQWTLYLKDGTRVEQSSDGQRTWDTNGNSILLGSDSDGAFIKDERTGRRVTWHGSTHDGHTDTIIQFPSVGGALQSVTVHWGTTSVQGKTYTYTDWNATAGEPCMKPFMTLDATLTVIRSIDFPSTESGAPPRTYTFSYNSDTSSQVTTAGGQYCSQHFDDLTRTASGGWGEVSKIVTPTGASINYTYSNANTHDFSGIQTSGSEIDLSAVNGIAGNGVTTKSIEHDGTTDMWKYSAAGVVNPDGSTHSEVYYPVDPLYGTCCGPGTQSMQGRMVKTIESGRVLVERHWTALSNPDPIGSRNAVNGNPVVDAEYTTLLDSDGQTRLKMSAKTFTYDFNGDLKTTTEYDWFPNINDVTYTNPGSPMFSYLRIPAGIPSNAQVLRVTTNSYRNSPDSDPDKYYYKRGSNPSSVILGKLKETDISDGVNAPKSTILFCYDGDTLCTGEPTLGNLTKVRAWDSARNVYADTITTYTPHGNIQSVTDPNGNVSQFTYGAVGTATDLYPTQTVQAYGTSVARTSTAVYDFYTGLMTTATDVDNNVSTSTIYDMYGRPTIVKNAVGELLENWIQMEISDSNRRIIVRSDQDTLGDGKHVSVQFYDQLGRVRLTKTLEDSTTQSATNETDGIKVETRFGYNDPTPNNVTDPQNTLGSYALTSNPFRAATSSAATTEATMGWTIKYSTRDGLHSEGTSYSGAAVPVLGSSTNSTGTVAADIYTNETLVVDQAGKKRISVSNAIGQLKEVWEITPSDQWTESVSFGSSNFQAYKTSYAYDILNNLTTVSQGTQLQNRTFSYSSLSRLITATNPESGTITYNYEPNGNLSNKIDARGVKTNYIYDALNRVTHRNYSLTGSTPANYQASPNVLYTYDDQPHAKGKLIKVSSSVSTTEYTGFDILGRVTSHKQTTDETDYTTAYTYKLNGALDEETYPSTRVVKNVLDTKGDLSVVESRKNSAAGYWNYANSFTYNPAGAVTSMQLGNGLWEKTAFNSRLQPTQIGLGTTAGTTAKLQLDYSYGTAQNNGNVQSQSITVPGMTYPLIQNYSYDSLNRLASAVEMSNSTQTWKQEFSYDRFGNRNFVTGLGHTDTLASCTTMCNPSFDPSKNQINSSGYSFDSGGNTTTDPSGRAFTYDGENKQVLVTNGGGMVGQYWYDGDGKRVKKYVREIDEMTVFVYDAAGKEIAEYSSVVASSTDAKVNYLTADLLGSPRINTDQNGSIVARHDYMPFGEEIRASQRVGGLGYSDDAVRKQFTEYERDGETELDFAQARYYSKMSGRFSSTDPLNFILEKQSFADDERARKFVDSFILDPQQWNKYSYTQNNPIRYTDPTGLYTCRDSAKCDTQDDIDFEAARQANLKSKDEKVRKAAEALGDPTIDNKVSVGFGTNPNGGGDTGLGFGKDGKYNGTIVVTISKIQMSADQKALQVQIAHEGTHVREYQNIIAGQYESKMTHRDSERNAYSVSERSVEEITFDPNTGIHKYNPDWKDEKAIDNYINSRPTLYPHPDSPLVDASRIPPKKGKS
jgi:RHS repeat-associated protein